jgi:hypothetical protein
MTYPPYGNQPDPTSAYTQPPPQQLPPMSGSPHGQAPGQPAQPPRKSHMLWALIALAAAIVFAGGGLAVAYNKGLILKDSGVKACEALRDGNKTFAGEQQNNTTMTETQYRTASCGRCSRDPATT